MEHHNVRQRTATPVIFRSRSKECLSADTRAILTKNPIRIHRKFSTIQILLTSRRHRRLTNSNFSIICHQIWKIAAAFITSCCFAHEGIFTDTVSVLAVNEEGIDAEFGAVGGEGAFRGGNTGVEFADWGDAVEVKGGGVGGFAAAFVVGGGIAHEGGSASAFSILAEDPIDVEGEGGAVFDFGAFRSNAD
jgi:hypothetical protein